MSFVRCEEEYGYVSRLTAIIGQRYSLSANNLPTAGLYNVCWLQPYDQIYFFENSRHWAKEITLERRYRMRGGDSGQFVSCHNVKYYAIPPHHLSQFFVAVPSRWRNYESSRLFYVPTPLFFAYYSAFILGTTERDLLFLVIVFNYCVPTLTAFLLTALICAP